MLVLAHPAAFLYPFSAGSETFGKLFGKLHKIYIPVSPVNAKPNVLQCARGLWKVSGHDCFCCLLPGENVSS